MFKSNWDESTLNNLREDLKTGLTFKECGIKYGVKSQRIHQLIRQHNLFDIQEDYGYRIITKQKKKLAESNQKEKYGLTTKEKKYILKEGVDSFINICYKKYKNKRTNCKRLGIPFDIDFNDIYFPTHCPILGTKLVYSNNSTNMADNIPSFDRLNPKLGYIKGNVKIISYRANRIKNDATLAELEAIIAYAKTYLN